jgi:hypothetical protein
MGEEEVKEKLWRCTRFYCDWRMARTTAHFTERAAIQAGMLSHWLDSGCINYEVSKEDNNPVHPVEMKGNEDCVKHAG